MFSGPWQQVVTRILLLLTPAIWIAWDFYTYATAGNASTESATILRWTAQAPGIALLFGILIGHLFFQDHKPTAYPGKATFWVSGWDHKSAPLAPGKVITVFLTSTDPGKREAFQIAEVDGGEL